MNENVNTLNSSAELSGSLAQSGKKVRDYTLFLSQIAMFYSKRSVSVIKTLLESDGSEFSKGMAIGSLIASGVWRSK